MTIRTDSTGTGTFSDVALVSPNIGPATHAGPDVVITLPSTAALVGAAPDDGLPVPASVGSRWLKLSGPGSVLFGDSAALSTTAAFGSAGSYLLRLVSGDGQVTTFDDLALEVNPLPQHALTVTASPLAGGSAGDSGVFPEGSSQPITASPSSGWHFAGWTGSGISNPSLASTTVTVDAAKTVTANFTISTFTVTYTAGAHGSISGMATQTIDHGSNATAVTAVQATGYRFVNWSDGVTENPRTDTDITADLTVSASFEANPPDANGNGILDTWEILMFGNADPGSNPAGADADADGFTNLMEFALNTHPAIPNASPLTCELVPGSEGQHLRLTAPKNPAATNLTYSIEVTGDLESAAWTSTGTTVETDTANELRVRDETGTVTGSHRFIRLKVTTN